VKLDFWLLDLNAHANPSGDAPEIWLWGIDSKGNRILVIDESFVDYFYTVLHDGANAAEVQNQVIAACGDSVLNLEASVYRYFGKPVSALKIYSHDKAKTAKATCKLDGVKECLEDDIRLTMQYLLTRNVVPCRWHDLEAQETPNTQKINIDKIYLAKSPLMLLSRNAEAPALRVMSLYSTCFSPEGSP
jgi:DNA polymerase elongation subunit (family B)